MGLTYTFRSSDAGATALANTAGAMITVLDAILVNGYNSKTVTITRTGTTATVNCTSHGFRDGQILAVSGANETDYNITARCTYVDANNVTYQVANSPATPATGTITAMVAPLGWTKAYTGTNKAAYRQPTVGANGFYLRVVDTDTADARLRGYETMSDVDTGTGLFPTTSQRSGDGAYFYKANGTGRQWRAYSNGKILYMFCQPTASTWGANSTCSLCFGDFTSNVGADAYNTVLCASPSANIAGNSSNHLFAYCTNYNSAGYANGHYIARPYTQTGTSLDSWKGATVTGFSHSSGVGSNAFFGGGGSSYPDPIFGGAVLGKPFLGESVSVRGFLTGLWMWVHNSGVATGDTFSGATGTSLEGRKFEAVLNASSIGTGAWVLETTDDWLYG